MAVQAQQVSWEFIILAFLSTSLMAAVQDGQTFARAGLPFHQSCTLSTAFLLLGSFSVLGILSLSISSKYCEDLVARPAPYRSPRWIIPRIPGLVGGRWSQTGFLDRCCRHLTLDYGSAMTGVHHRWIQRGVLRRS